MRVALLLFLSAVLAINSSRAQVYYQDVPDIPKSELKNIRAWIRERTTSARLPFCWRRTYYRGVGVFPGRVADCPPTYTNNGATCGRGPRDIRYPSKVANCPSGYTNMGYTCYRGPSTYWKSCTLPWKKHHCRPGYTDNGCTCGRGASSLGMSHMTCPPGYFQSKFTARCHKTCAAGYTNTGDYCHRPVSTLGMGSMRCLAGEHRIGARCYGGRSLTSCFKGQVGEAGLCYAPCRAGYYGLATICWQSCNKGWVNCGAACTATSMDCGINVVTQVIAPLVIAANIASLGLTKPAFEGAKQSLKIGGRVVTSSTKPGKALIFAVNELQSIRPANLKKGASVVRRIYKARTGTVFKQTKLRVNMEITAITATDRFTTAYAEDFPTQTSRSINDEIDRRFTKKVALFIKKMWAMNQLSEMAEANGWNIAQSVLATVSIADITGVTGAAEAYAKPKCQVHKPFPCSPKLKMLTGC